MTPREARIGRLAAGLVAALVLGVGAGWWHLGRSLRALEGESARRGAVAVLSAVTAAVERLGLDDPGLQATMAAYGQAHPEIASIRVVQFQGVRLAASTAPADAGESAAPRRMARAEKDLYDLGQRLRAEVETNRREGRAWKPELDVAEQAGGALRLAAPVEEEGVVAGAVIVEARPVAPELPRLPGTAWALALIVVPPALFALGGRRLAGRPLAATAAAAALLALALAGYGLVATRSLAAGRHAAEAALAERLRAEAGRVEALAPELEPADPARWDVDAFRRPLGLQTAAGPDPAAVEAVIAAAARRLHRRQLSAGVVAAALLAFIGLGAAARTGRALRKYRRAYLYALPAMATMVVLVFGPFVYAIVLSFTNQSIYNTDQPVTEIWVGLDNYSDILGNFDLFRVNERGERVFNYHSFYWTLPFTVVWTVSNVTIGVTVGLLLALILNTRGLALRPIYRVLLILPWAVPNYITSLIWKGMFHSQFGVINQVIQAFGGAPVSWFESPFTSFLTVLSTNGWLSFPFMMVISLGALQSIPADLYEAARVDGASRWQQFRNITLPSLKPALIPAIIISVVWTFNMFNIIYLVSEGEPGGATEILITEAYKIAFQQYRYGYAAAYSTLIFLILLAYGMWQNRATHATEGI